MSASAPIAIANASRSRDEIPGCIARTEAAAEFAWSSKRRLQVTKGNKTADLSADDLRGLLRFVEQNRLGEQL